MAVSSTSTTITVSGGLDSGTATSGSSTTLTDTGKSWTTNAFVDRICWIRSGSGAKGIGRITANTATILTVEFATFEAANGVVQKTPSSGSVYSISHNFQDFVDASFTGITKTGNNQFYMTKKLQLSSAGLFHDFEKQFDQNTGSIDTPIAVSSGCTISFGFLDTNDSTSGGCSISVFSTRSSSSVDYIFGGPTGGGGQAKFYASTIHSEAPNAVRGFFWTLNNSTLDSDWKDCSFVGWKGGARVEGADTRMKNLSFIEQSTTAGPLNFVGAIGLAENISVQNSDYAFYWFFGFGGATVRGLSSRDVVATVLLWGGSGSGNLELIDYVGDPFTFQNQNGPGDSNKVEEIYTYTPITIDSSSIAIDGAGLRISDLSDTEVFNAASDVNGKFSEILLLRGKYKASTGSAIDAETPHTIRYRKYGFVFQQLSFTADGLFKSAVVLSDNLLTAADESTAGGYTGITFNGAAKTILVSGSRSIQELYDHGQWWAAQTANMQYEEPVQTADGLSFSLPPSWTITVTGSLVEVDALLTDKDNDLTVGAGGYFEDIDGAIWEAAGTTYYASAVSHTMLSAGIPVQDAELAYFDSLLTNVTYNSSRVQVTSLTSDALGKVSGYTVYKTNLVDLSDQILIAREYSYREVSLAAVPNGKAISFDIALAVNNFITLPKASAALLTGIDINYTTLKVSVTEAHSLTDIYDYFRYFFSLAGNLDELSAAISTSDGVSYLYTSDWGLDVTGVGVDVVGLTQSSVWQGTGGLTVASSGFYEDSLGAIWEDTATIVYASAISHSIKSGVVAIVGANLAYYDSSNTNRTRNSSRISVDTLSSDGSGNIDGYVVYRIDAVFFSAQNNRVRDYNYGALSIPATITGSKISTTVQMEVNPFLTELTEATVAAYTGILIDYPNEAVTITSDATHHKIYDYAQYQFAQPVNFQYLTAAINTSDGVNHIYALNWNLEVTGAGVHLEEIDVEISSAGGGVLITTDGAFLEDTTNVVWDDAGVRFRASHAWFEVLDGVTAAPIPLAAIGWGDELTQTKLMYDKNLNQTGLLTDAAGKAEGYMVYSIGPTTYSQTKMVIGEYNYQFLTIPRTANGSQIGSDTQGEISRLSEDTQVTLSKAGALAVTGVTITHAAKNVANTFNPLTNSYDYIKAVQASIVDIEPGIPGCLSFCLYGSLVDKSGTTFIGINDWTYQELGNTGKFVSGIVEFAIPGVVSKKYEGNIFQYATAGTYDFRGSNIDGSVTLQTTAGQTVLVKFNPAVSFINLEPGNITVEASVAVIIAAPNIIDDSRYQFYNVTQDIELDNAIVSGGSGAVFNGTLGPGEEVEDGDAIRMRATYVSGLTAMIQLTATAVATESGIQFVSTQVVDSVYAAWALDGSTVTEFSMDIPNLDVDVNDPDGLTQKLRLGAWLKYIVTVPDGIRHFFGAVITVSAADIRIDTDVIDMQMSNVAGFEVYFDDNDIRLYRDDLGQIIASGSDSMFLDYSGVPFVIETGVSGLTPAEAADLAQIDKTLTKNQFIALK